jgi:non-specific serine/threonine protein kinase/serine/threonine-protein kinase
MDSREVLARFEAERQALALMDHPCIAKVYDAGTTPQGRPWFAMEYVRGIRITDYCDKRRLSTADRVQLFQRVCDGVQHAHQKAVLHRDLKPGNILVADVDGKPLPKIIDFGVAKATTQKLTEKTMYTAMGQLIGTPEYMSPEQAELTGEDIDTRTDVYSLGVILYELLAGALPFKSKELRRAGFEGIARMIREQDPPRPSTRLTTLGNQTTEIASRRRTDPKHLLGQLRGDLDWIVMRCLEKDRNRRYGSPQELRQDIQRHLRHEPVLAGPPSRVYRARKFVRRHQMAVAFTSLGLIAVVAFVIAMTIQSARVRQQATYARQVSDFMTDLFLDFDPLGRGSTVTLREVLDAGATRAREELFDQPLVQARMMMTIGNVYTSLDLYEEAEPLLLDAVEILERQAPAGDAWLGTVLVQLGSHYRVRGDYENAEERFLRALPIVERTKGRNDATYTTALHALAVLRRFQARYEEAERLYLEVLEIRRRTLGEEHPDVAKILSDLAVVYYYEGRYDDAMERTREALAIREAILPAGHASIGESYNNLGALARRQEQYEQAREFLEKALAIQIEALGSSHNQVARTRTNLGAVFESLDDLDAALEQQEAALAIFESTFGAEHTSVATVLTRIAAIHRKRGELERAMQLAERAYSINEASLGNESPAVADDLAEMARIETDRGVTQAAEARYRQALKILEAVLGADSPRTAEMRREFAEALDRGGRTARADSLRALDG